MYQLLYLELGLPLLVNYLANNYALYVLSLFAFYKLCQSPQAPQILHMSSCVLIDMHAYKLYIASYINCIYIVINVLELCILV